MFRYQNSSKFHIKLNLLYKFKNFPNLLPRLSIYLLYTFRVKPILNVATVFISTSILNVKYVTDEKRMLKACLTQNTRLIRLAIRVNRTFNRTNRGLIQVTLGPFEYIRESRV